MSPDSDLTARLFDHFTTRQPLRTGSLIVTIFGDSIAPRGGVVWIGSLIEALAPLGISHRLVRTAMFRLVQDGILHNEQVGRRSFYALTDAGRVQFNTATARIYSQPQHQWQGQWCLVLLSNVPVNQRAAVRRELAWLGFGQFGPDTLAHPHPDRSRLYRQLEHLGVRSSTILLDAQLAPDEPVCGLQQLASQGWDLAALEDAYRAYVELFKPILEAIQTGHTPSDADAFYIRTFMIHEYRKAVLRDPALPDELLPDGWQGHVAYQLSGSLYRQVASGSERYIDTAFEAQQGALPELAATFGKRFGGLGDGFET
jgi:phenylacetic acid degradation operon negative regulatory protein